VTDPADLAHEVLIRVAEFVRKLPAEQLADLASGEARIALVAKGGRVAVPGGTASGGTRAAARGAADQLPHPAEQIATTMAEIADRTAARRYLEVDLKLTGPKLQRLAAELGIAIPARPKAKQLDGIVEWAVGRRLDSEAISRAGGAR
jgi:hypothetical protein